MQYDRNWKIFHLLRLVFKVHLSKIGIDVSEKLCQKHGIFFFQHQNKGRYIRCYMSASKIKPRENTEMYVHIVASWLQLVYIWWVFYVRMLSICHKFIDSNISGELILCNLFYCLQKNKQMRSGPRGTKAHWINPYEFILSVWKVIISRELAQSTLSTIGFIPSHF